MRFVTPSAAAAALDVCILLPYCVMHFCIFKAMLMLMLMLSILVSKKLVAKQEHVHVCIKSLNRLVCTACWPDLDANFECISNFFG